MASETVSLRKKDGVQPGTASSVPATGKAAAKGHNGNGNGHPSGAVSGASVSKTPFWGRHVKNKELMVMTRQLSTTLGAGLLLTESLDVISEDMENRYFHDVLMTVRRDLEGGSDFTQALARFPRIFSKTYIAIVRSGEATGALHKTMANLAKYLEASEDLREKVVTAIRYPLFVLGFAVMVVLIMVLFLIPKFADMFSHAGAQLPLITRIVVGVSNFCLKYSWAMIAGVVVSAIAVWHALKLRPVRTFFDAMALKLPILGKEVIHKVYMSRFCRTLGFLLDGGVNVATALEITAQVSNSIPIASAVERIKQRVVGGSEMSIEIRRQRVFSALVGKMAGVGERTGRLPDLLSRTADYYDAELENALLRLTSILEPMLIVFIGGMVLVVVLAMYLPIFSMSKAIRG